MILSKKYNTYYSIVDQSLSSLSNFMITALAGRYLEKEYFGTYILLMTIWMFLYFLQNGIISQNVLILYNNDDSHEQTLQGLFHIFSMPAAIICGVISSIVFKIENITSILFSLALYSMVYKEYCRSKMQAKGNFIYSVISNFFCIITIIFLIYFIIKFETLDLKTIWKTVIVSNVIYIFFYKILYKEKVKTEFNINKIKTIIKFPLWNGMTNISIWANANFFKYIASYYLGLTTLATIGAAQNIMYVSNPILNGIQSYIIPTISKDRKSKKNCYKLLIFASLIISLLVYVFSELIFKTIYGHKFTTDYYILKFYAINLLINTIGRLINIELICSHKVKNAFYINIITTILSIISAALLIKFYKIHGFCAYLIISPIIYSFISALYINYDRQQRF